MALDGEDMSARNAAIWYAQDGFDPVAKGINGRRVAGESFLRGFLRHGDVPEFALISRSAEDIAAVRTLAARVRPEVPLRHVPLVRPANIAPTKTIFFPSPNFTAEAWRRAPYGTSAWAICGVTHTISTAAVMQGFFDLRMGPVMPWDAVMCTSSAVQGAVLHQMELIDDHVRRHLRAEPPPRPMLPVLPLGVHCDDFTRDPAAGAALRARLGAGPQDVVFTTIARLTPHEKFDPLPIYLAMQKAAQQLPGQKLFLALCGMFRDDYSRKVFETGAARLMPDVGFALLDGADAGQRREALSGADVFLFLIDNIQETFGLAPIEAMAAGLPLLVTDWDGMKDTVSPEVGIRVPTRMLSPQHLASEALRYQGGIDSYVQYCASTSAMTEVDMPALGAAILTLARDPDLRARMGAAGQARARGLYDWSQIIPQMQDIWAEQDRMRRADPGQRYGAHALPVAPAPSALFGGYPTEIAGFGPQVFVPTGRDDLQAVLAVRNYQGLNRIFAAPDQIAAILTALGEGGTAPKIAAALSLAPIAVERTLIWLLKYDFIRRA
jgi:glycosyltransferase involved in cell wall biosynthesis